MEKKNIITGFFIGLFLLTSALIKAHCCKTPTGHCTNWHVIYTNDTSQALETNAGQLVTIAKDSAGNLICPKCKHTVMDHGCDPKGFPVGPRYKKK